MRAIIKHPAFEKGRLALSRALDTRMRGQIIFVVGMSGIGKSEIRYDAIKSIAGPPETWTAGQIPVIPVRATPTDRSTFSPKEFITRLYLAFFEPDFSWAVRRADVGDSNEVHAHMDERLACTFGLDMRAKRTEHQMRTYVERMAPIRGLRAIFIDEAASLTYTHPSKRPVDHMINYMCLAEEIGITLVLFGVPRVAALWEGDAEILRRSRFVFIDRYRHDKKDDLKSFERLATMIAKEYPFSRFSLVNRTLDLAYASSAGVFGEINAFYRRADDLRAIDGCSSICRRHLEGAVSNAATLATLHAEAALFDSLRTPADAATICRLFNDERGRR
ncbi:AAA family ATPase [Dyella sp.]|uniref:AAA family ATPase n=1 Tax=Dyella sp. TaxID=1869338 RepID=UPI002B46A3AC|nr:AAA family ATPase [Dyella sp.]HKT26563.1 AAA family ATPase [Dyella sp.]